MPGAIPSFAGRSNFTCCSLFSITSGKASLCVAPKASRAWLQVRVGTISFCDLPAVAQGSRVAHEVANDYALRTRQLRELLPCALFFPQTRANGSSPCAPYAELHPIVRAPKPLLRVAQSLPHRLLQLAEAVLARVVICALWARVCSDCVLLQQVLSRRRTVEAERASRGYLCSYAGSDEWPVFCRVLPATTPSPSASCPEFLQPEEVLTVENSLKPGIFLQGRVDLLCSAGSSSSFRIVELLVTREPR